MEKNNEQLPAELTLDEKPLASIAEVRRAEQLLKEKIEKGEVEPSRIVEVTPGTFKTLQKLNG